MAAYPQAVLCWSRPCKSTKGDSRIEGRTEIRFARLDGLGNHLGDEVTITDSLRSGGPDLAWDGTRYGLAWTTELGNNEAELFFLSIDHLGVPIGTPVQLTDSSAIASQPTLAWTGSEFGIVWLGIQSGVGTTIFSFGE